MLIPIALSIFSLLFLLLAARKLFESDEARALNHWQYLIAFGGLLAVSLAVLGANQFTNESMEWGFLNLGYLVLLAAVLIFATGRMEVGDEMWHVKRLFPLLRPFDQTIPYLAVVGAIWFVLVGMIPTTAASPMLSKDAVTAFQWSSTASFFFFVIFARFMTAMTGSAARAFRVTLGVVCALTFLTPMLAGAGRFALNFDPLWSTLEAFSPAGMLGRMVFANVGATTYAGAAKVAAFVMIVSGLVLGIFGEWRRYQRWKHYDYHYDMPSR
jgi:hypothetical protein